jgi:hypothetical protein
VNFLFSELRWVNLFFDVLQHFLTTNARIKKKNKKKYKFVILFYFYYVPLYVIWFLYVVNNMQINIINLKKIIIMKKITLLFLAITLTIAGWSQAIGVKHADKLVQTSQTAETKTLISNSTVALPTQTQNLRALPPVLFSDDFSTSSNWTSDGKWVIGTTAAAGTYSGGMIINSTTKTNGFAKLDADLLSIAGASSLTLATPLDCSAAEHVALTFETFYRKFDDKIFVRVSDDNSNWTSFEILPDLVLNASTANPTNVVTDITSVAAGKSTVWIQFYYTGYLTSTDYGYAWFVDDVNVYDGEIIDPPTAKTQSHGGLWSGTTAVGANDLIYLTKNEAHTYVSVVTNAQSATWAFDPSANIISSNATTTDVSYNTVGTKTATLNVLGNDESTLAPSVTFDVLRPWGLSDFVTNLLPDDLLSVYSLSGYNNDYTFGFNRNNKVIAETYIIPDNETVTVNSIVLFLYYYQLSQTNRNAVFTISFRHYDPATGTVGSVIRTFTPSFGTIFGANTINGVTTQKQWNLTTPVTVTGSFIITYSFAAISGNPGGSSRLGLISATGRTVAPYATAYNFNTNTLALTNPVTGGSSLYSYLGVTYDVEPVEIEKYTPVEDATDVALNAAVSVTFNQGISAPTLTGITIQDDANNNVAGIVASVSNDLLIIEHADFVNSHTYTVTIPAGTVTGYAGAITWSFTTPCTEPSSLVCTASTPTSAEISWSNVGAGGYEVFIQETNSPAPDAATTPTTTNVVINTNKAVFSNLQANTSYWVWVRSVCGANSKSDWSTAFNFRTPCEAIAITAATPLFENFDSYPAVNYQTVGSIPDCWYTYAESGNANFYPHITTQSYTYPHSQPNGLTFTAGSNSFGGANTYAVMPAVDLPLNELIFSFYYGMESLSYGTLTVGYLTGAQSDLSSYTVIETIPNYQTTNTVPTFITVDISAVPLTATYLAFRWSLPNSYWSCAIDDVTLRLLSDENDIVAFTFPQQTGDAIINTTSHTVNIEVNYLSDLTALTPTIVTSPYATVSLFGVVSPAGDEQDFSVPVQYVVTSEIGTPQIWTVNVTKALTASAAKDILTFTLPSQTAPATIATVAASGTVDINIAFTANLAALTPTITTSPFSTITPLSGVVQDFTSPVTYTVTAEDATEKTYIVTVTQDIAPLGAACSNPIPYTINTPEYIGTMNTISREMWFTVTLDQKYTDVAFMTCPSTYDTKLYIYDACGGTELGYNDDATPSDLCVGVPDNNQSYFKFASLNAGTYYAKVTPYSSIGTTTGFLVTGNAYVSSSANDILTYAIAEQVEAAIIDASAKTVNVTILSTSDVTNLTVSSITVSEGASITSPAVTPVDFSTPVEYVITAEDGTATTWTVTVTVTILSSANDILTYAIAEQVEAAVIDATVKTVNVTILSTSDVTNLTVSDVTVSEGASITSPTVTPVDFSSPVDYVITAEDGTVANWTVTVTIASSTQLSEGTSILVYPNPNHGEFTINLPQIEKAMSYQIIDVKGAVIMEKIIEDGNANEQISLKVAAGTYYIKVITNSKVYLEPIIVK